MTTDPSLPSYRSARAGARVLQAEGVRWLVFEFQQDYDRRSSTSLIFDGDAVVRRVREYPTNWRELSDQELIALSARS